MTKSDILKLLDYYRKILDDHECQTRWVVVLNPVLRRLLLSIEGDIINDED